VNGAGGAGSIFGSSSALPYCFGSSSSSPPSLHHGSPFSTSSPHHGHYPGFPFNEFLWNAHLAAGLPSNAAAAAAAAGFLHPALLSSAFPTALAAAQQQQQWSHSKTPPTTSNSALISQYMLAQNPSLYAFDLSRQNHKSEHNEDSESETRRSVSPKSPAQRANNGDDGSHVNSRSCNSSPLAVVETAIDLASHSRRKRDSSSNDEDESVKYGHESQENNDESFRSGKKCGDGFESKQKSADALREKARQVLQNQNDSLAPFLKRSPSVFAGPKKISVDN